MLSKNRFYAIACIGFFVFFLLFSIFEIWRGFQKLGIQETHPTPITLEKIDSWDQYGHQWVTIDGRMDRQLVVQRITSQEHDSVVRVFGLFHPSGSPDLLLVDRGYFTGNVDELQASIDHQDQTLVGRLVPVSSGGLKYPSRIEPIVEKGLIWVKTIKLDELSHQWQQPLAKWMVALPRSSSWSLDSTNHYKGLSAHRHFAYALEFALLAGVVWWGYRQVR